MQIILDGKSNFALDGEAENVVQVLAEVDSWLSDQGRTMISITVDGEKINPDTLTETLGERAADDVRTLEVRSEVVLTLVQTSISEMEEVIPDLASACHSLAEIFQSESPQEGYEKFPQLVEIWEVLKVRQSQVVRALALKLDDLSFENRSLSARQDDLNTFLEEAADALEAKDGVLLGDLLEYELAPLAEEEEGVVAFLRSKVPEGSG